MGRALLDGDKDLPPLALNVRRLRVSLGLTQPELAAKTGMSQSNVSEMERGNSKQITHEQLERLASVLGVTRDALYTDPKAFDEDPSFRAFLASDFATGVTEAEKARLRATQFRGAPIEAWYQVLQAIRIQMAAERG